ncbi:MAG: mechanosensitive ion channel family protein, partial [Candidatus Eremiobacteraeota bacterium]|nr:mechanosensitive ion channel family protein [Candidatus Eremiobacteraeota bacterium]
MRYVRTLVALVAVMAVVLVLGATRLAVLGQTLTLPGAATSGGLPGIEQHGNFTTAPVILDGVTLFRVAVETSAPNQLTAAGRIADIATALGQVLATVDSPGRETSTVYDPASLRVHVVHSGLADALEVVDARHTDPLPIVTITAVDAQYNQTTVDALATDWQGKLQSALIRALALRQPAAQRRGIARVLRVAVGMVVLSLLVFGLRALLQRRIAAVALEVEERARTIADEASSIPVAGVAAPQRRRRFLALSLRAVKPERRLALDRAVAESLLWGLALAWCVAITWALTLFPQTTPFAQQLMRGTFGIVTTIVVVALINRVLDAVIVRAASVWRSSPFMTSDDKARRLLRIPTIAQALGSFKTFVLVFVAVLGVLSQIGVPIGSVVTIGGLAAIALSLAAQNFVRDFLNGFLVLFEDQYVVGDYVTINTYSGIVEVLTLRMVQIRDTDGRLITIPHSATTAVVNQSRNWSRVDYRVPVDPASDVLHALEVVRGAIEALAREYEWRDVVLEPIEWIGIDALSRDWAIVRAIVKTAPLRQFAFRHAINARVRTDFANAGIALG